MKLTQLSALSAAIMLATTAQANSFVDDSSLNIELRTHFHDRAKEGHKNSKDYDERSSQWAQAIRADFSSGYFENIVGIDINAYYALKLGASNVDGYTNPGVLPVDAKGDSSSYGKTGYAIKFNLMDMGVLKYGRMQLDTPLINDSDSRALPSMSEAFYGDFAYEGLKTHVVWATKANAKTKSGFVDYMAEDKKKADNKEPVKAIGASYDFGNGLGLSADYATQDDFAKKYLTEVTYATDISGMGLGFAAQYAKYSNIGYAKDKHVSNGYSDDSINAWGIKVDASIQQATFGLAYTKVEDSDLGKFNNNWGGEAMDGNDDTGYFGYNSIQYSDFNARAQKAIGLSAGYDFAGIVDGLSADAIYVTSDFKNSAGNKQDEKEYNFRLKYAFPQVEGLSAQLRYAKNTKENDGHKDTVTSDTRVILKYNVAVF
ncbi:OprD family porin [Endozoicomonas gorgoniicola]|uniref:OprD family porin n=1 Tax=Endozoicomonas gorgoniicola TaxID=1234144 RepID=A0ABT3MVX1_9GAMM|nr:OprD family porin [Endozoicomonas gorgoniicola]MCW7553524.1 OprD family porin [Endozoicomonas gorgoniicola]